MPDPLDPTTAALKESMLRDITQQADDEAKRLLRYICPIYRPDRRGNPEQFGTGTLLNVGSRFFLITAAHVLDNANRATLYVPSTKQLDEKGKIPLVELHGPSFRSAEVDGSRDNDRTDIGAVEITDALLAGLGPENFFAFNQLDQDDTGQASAVYIAMGYPAVKNSKIDSVNKSLRRNPVSCTGNLLPLGDLTKLGHHSGSHLLLSFDKKDTKNTEGKRIVPPDPIGVSGGPLLRFDIYGPESQRSRLVGIIIEWISTKGIRGLLATRIPVILEGIRFQYADLRPVIPYTPTVRVTVTAFKT